MYGVRWSYTTEHTIIFMVPNRFSNVFKGHSYLPVHFLDDTNKQERDFLMAAVLLIRKNKLSDNPIN